MLNWWSENGPPVYISVAGYLGLVKTRKSKTSGKPSPKAERGDLEELARMFSSTGGMIQ